MESLTQTSQGMQPVTQGRCTGTSLEIPVHGDSVELSVLELVYSCHV